MTPCNSRFTAKVKAKGVTQSRMESMFQRPNSKGSEEDNKAHLFCFLFLPTSLETLGVSSASLLSPMLASSSFLSELPGGRPLKKEREVDGELPQMPS